MSRVRFQNTSAKAIVRAVDGGAREYTSYPFGGRRFTVRDRPGRPGGDAGRQYSGPGIKPERG